MKYLLDENLSSLHARTLRSLGHDAVSVVELGLGGADDSAVRAAAIDGAIRWVVALLAEIDVAGKLVVVDEKRIRIRS